MELNNESKTLFIPLLSKALVSKSNLFLHDSKALEIVSKIDFDFKSLNMSKWLAMFLSVRALVIDEICDKYILKHLNPTIIHLGCGLDSRNLRVNQSYKMWYDIDYKEVIEIRKKFYYENEKYKMIGSSVLDYSWLEQVEVNDNILIVLEGLTMYLKENEIQELIFKINEKFGKACLVFDAYSKRGVKFSKFKNPVKQMNAEIKYGMDSIGEFLLLNDKLEYINTYLIKKDDNNLHGFKKFIFNNLYCGKISQSLYKIYEFNLRR